MKKNENTLADYICIICVIVMTTISVVLLVYLLRPPKAYVQEWTSEAGITYFISNMHMISVSSNSN